MLLLLIFLSNYDHGHFWASGYLCFPLNLLQIDVGNDRCPEKSFDLYVGLIIIFVVQYVELIAGYKQRWHKQQTQMNQ